MIPFLLVWMQPTLDIKHDSSSFFMILIWPNNSRVRSSSVWSDAAVNTIGVAGMIGLYQCDVNTICFRVCRAPLSNNIHSNLHRRQLLKCIFLQNIHIRISKQNENHHVTVTWVLRRLKSSTTRPFLTACSGWQQKSASLLAFCVVPWKVWTGNVICDFTPRDFSEAALLG